MLPGKIRKKEAVSRSFLVFLFCLSVSFCRLMLSLFFGCLSPSLLPSRLHLSLSLSCPVTVSLVLSHVLLLVLDHVRLLLWLILSVELEPPVNRTYYNPASMFVVYDKRRDPHYVWLQSSPLCIGPGLLFPGYSDVCHSTVLTTTFEL